MQVDDSQQQQVLPPFQLSQPVSQQVDELLPPSFPLPPAPAPANDAPGSPLLLLPDAPGPGAAAEVKSKNFEKWVQELCPGTYFDDDPDTFKDPEEAEKLYFLVRSWHHFWHDWPEDYGQEYQKMLEVFCVEKNFNIKIMETANVMWCDYMQDLAKLINYFDEARRYREDKLGGDYPKKDRERDIARFQEMCNWHCRFTMTLNHIHELILRRMDVRGPEFKDYTLMLPDSNRLLDPHPNADFAKMSPKQYVLELILKDAERKKFIRIENKEVEIYEPIYNGRRFMHYYKRYSSVPEYIAEVKYFLERNKRDDLDKFLKVGPQWLEMELKTRYPRAKRLPLCQTNRSWFAFSNGAFWTSLNKFYHVDSPEYKEISTEVLCCNYFENIEFPDEQFEDIKKEYEKTMDANKEEKPGEWFMRIPTKECDEVIGFQNWPRDVQIVFWALIGRMFRNVGDGDKWQVAPIFEGKSGSGKSTIAEMIYTCYHMQDVGILSNDMQETFGLEHIYKKYIVAGLDLKRNFKLPEMLANCMISGEALVVNRKHKISIDLIWNVPLLFACTEFPGWLCGMQRRLVTFPFMNAPSRCKIRDNLKDAMFLERAHFMKKANEAYFYWKTRCEKAGSFRASLPPFFDEVQRRRLYAQSYVMRFLVDYKQQNIIDWGGPNRAQFYCEKSMLQNCFEKYCQDKKVRNIMDAHYQLDNNRWEDARQYCEMSLVLGEKRELPHLPGTDHIGDWFQGVAFKQDLPNLQKIHDKDLKDVLDMPLQLNLAPPGAAAGPPLAQPPPPFAAPINPILPPGFAPLPIPPRPVPSRPLDAKKQPGKNNKKSSPANKKKTPPPQLPPGGGGRLGAMFEKQNSNNKEKKEKDNKKSPPSIKIILKDPPKEKEKEKEKAAVRRRSPSPPGLPEDWPVPVNEETEEPPMEQQEDWKEDLARDAQERKAENSRRNRFVSDQAQDDDDDDDDEDYDGPPSGH